MVASAVSEYVATWNSEAGCEDGVVVLYTEK